MNRFLISVLITLASLFSFGQNYNSLQKEIINGDYKSIQKECEAGLLHWNGQMKTRSVLIDGEFRTVQKLPEGKQRKKDILLITLGDIARMQKKYDTAAAYYNQVLEKNAVRPFLYMRWQKRIKNNFGAFLKHHYAYDLDDKLAFLYIETGNFLKAKEFIDKVKAERKIRYKKSNFRRYRSLYTQAHYYQSLGQNDSASFYAAQYILSNTNTEMSHYNDLFYLGNAYKILAEVALKNKNLEQGLEYAEENKKIQFHLWTKRKAGKNTLNKIVALDLLANFHLALGELEDAETYSKRAIKSYNETIVKKEVTYAQLLLTQAKINFANDQYEEATKKLVEGYDLQYAFLIEKLPLLTEYERENFYKKLYAQSQIMNAYSVKIISQNPNETYATLLTNKVFSYTFNTKGILLSTINKFNQIVTDLPEDNPTKRLYEKWKQEKAILSNYMVYLDYSADKKKIDLQQTLVNELETSINQEMATYLGDSKTTFLDNENIHEHLAPTDVLVNIVKTPQLSDTAPYTINDSLFNYAYLIATSSARDISFYWNKEGTALDNKKYLGYKNHIKHKLEDNLSYQSYLGVIDPQLKDKNRVFFVNDGVYNLININTLKDASGKYLQDSKQVITLTSAADLLKSVDFSLPKEGITLFGHPVYNTSQGNRIANADEDSRGIIDVKNQIFTDLPGTEIEVQHIKSSLANNDFQASLFLGVDASE